MTTTATHLAEVEGWAIYEKPDIIYGSSVLSAEDCIADAARWIAGSHEGYETDAQLEALKATLADPQARVASGYHLARCSQRLVSWLDENGGHGVPFVMHGNVMCLQDEALSLDSDDPDQVIVTIDNVTWGKILIGGVPVCKGPGDAIERLAADLRGSETLRDYCRQYVQGKEELPTCALYYGQEFTCQGKKYRFTGVLDAQVTFTRQSLASRARGAVVVGDQRLEAMADTYSADTLGDFKKPYARGVFRHQGQLYVTTGTLGCGAVGTIQVNAQPIEPVDVPAAAKKVTGSAAYSYQPSLFD